MAVRGNIGDIRSAIEEGRRAFDNVDYGPVVPAEIRDMEGNSSDWQSQVINPNIFIMGIHKWADPTLKVTE